MKEGGRVVLGQGWELDDANSSLMRQLCTKLIHSHCIVS